MLLYFLFLLCVISWFESQKCKIKPYHAIAIQIQSWLFKTPSKYSPKFFSNEKSMCSTKYLKNASFSQQKCRISFQLTKSKSGPNPKFWRVLQSRSNPNSIKFAWVLIQSNPSPVQYPFLMSNVHLQDLTSDARLFCENKNANLINKLKMVFGKQCTELL